MRSAIRSIPALTAGSTFPPVESAWGPDSPANGLLAVGGALDIATLRSAYERSIFPWFSEGQPILWWSPDPRMALDVAAFRLHKSLKRVIKRFVNSPTCEIKIDSNFFNVIGACADRRRNGQGANPGGTWILPEMVDAYCSLHRAGLAHSVETWIDGELAGGLYCTAIGQAVFGESMFALQTDASKIALAALVCFCRANGIERIDCQQNTQHLAFLGAREVPRSQFVEWVESATPRPPPIWQFDNLYWQNMLSDT